MYIVKVIEAQNRLNCEKRYQEHCNIAKIMQLTFSQWNKLKLIKSDIYTVIF